MYSGGEIFILLMLSSVICKFLYTNYLGKINNMIKMRDGYVSEFKNII